MFNLNEISLSNSCKQVLLGTLLGDGSLKLQKNYKNVRFQMRHSVVQASYFYWKVEMLKEIAINKAVYLSEPDGFSNNKKLHFQSRALESLTALHKITHLNNKLHIRRRWLNCLTPLSLAVWWLDDGSLITNGRQGVICTDGFNVDSVKILSRFLEVVWGVKTRVRPANKKNPFQCRLFLSTSETKNLFRIILPFIPVKEMLPKVLIRYKDYNYQQRWISEVKEKVAFDVHDFEIERLLLSFRK